jgi:hypothetical protein
MTFFLNGLHHIGALNVGKRKDCVPVRAVTEMQRLSLFTWAFRPFGPKRAVL